MNFLFFSSRFRLFAYACAFAFCGLLGAGLSASPAAADYRLCNETSYALQSAIAYESDGDWHSQGWFLLHPGACETAIEGSVTSGPYYVFARSIDAHQGGTKYFGGTERFCTVAEDFQISGRDACLARGFDSQDFVRVDPKSGSGWVTSFSEPGNFTRERSKTAGVQRLLQDNGYKISRIDGYGGRNTTRAVMSFQRSINVKPDGNITPDLINQLIDGAAQEQKKTGLSLCNETDYLVWSAVGEEIEGGELESSGWIRIEPGVCRKAVKGKLTAQTYYLYSEAIDTNGARARRDDRELVWGGDHTFCTKSARFQIRGQENCRERGFDEAGFRAINVGNASRWVEKLR